MCLAIVVAAPSKSYLFKSRLLEGLIISRPNRFIMMVELDGRVVRCHCPSTGRIGDIKFENIPCLLSRPEKSSGSIPRKTAYTVEAISLDPPSRKRKTWIGINQNRANDYVWFFLKTGQLPLLASRGAPLEREVRLGHSRIDFSSGNTFIEVKTPLIWLPSAEGLRYQRHGPFHSFDRLIRHFTDLARIVRKGSRAIVMLCYLYDAKPFQPPPPDKSSGKIQRAVRAATTKGVENWQINLRIDGHGIDLIRYFRLKPF